MTLDSTVLWMEGRVPVTVLKLQGDIDASNYTELVAAARQVYADGARDLLLDLGGVSYVSSSGVVALNQIAALMRGEKTPDIEVGWGALHAVDRDRALGMQPHFKLLNPQPRVARVLDTVGLDKFLQIFTDLDEAVASF